MFGWVLNTSLRSNKFIIIVITRSRKLESIISSREREYFTGGVDKTQKTSTMESFATTVNSFQLLTIVEELAMYKTRNTGTGNGMRGTRGMGGMLYSGECRQTFRGMSSNIPGNVAKHSGECPQTFRGMSPNYYHR